MALANSPLPSHITFDSSAALLRSRQEIREEKQTNIPQLLPRLSQKYRDTQIDSFFSSLPDELHAWVLSACSTEGSSDALLKLGLTSKYWHLRVRSFIEDSPQGQAFRRAHEYHRFFIRHGKSPAEVAKQALNEDEYGENEMPAVVSFSELTSSCAPFIVSVPHSLPMGQRNEWWDKLLGVLTARNGCVTVLDMWNETDPAQYFMPAVKATPAGSYLALKFHSSSISGERAETLARVMKEHSVVCMVTILNNSIAAKTADLSLIFACAKHQVEGILFRLDCIDFNNKEAQQLADGLQQFETSVSFEVTAPKTSKESVKIIIDAVRSMNIASPAQVSITFEGAAMRKALGVSEFKDLAEDGIHFIETQGSRSDFFTKSSSSDDDSDNSIGSASREENSSAEYESSAEDD